MQLNFWLLPDIFFPYLSTLLLVYPHHILKGRDGSNIARSAHGHAGPIVYLRRTFGFWRGSEKPPADEMPAIENHRVTLVL